MMQRASVECRDVRLSYGRTDVLQGVSLKVGAGEFFVLLGPSGSGKSTLLRLIAGFNRQQSGSVLIDGEDVSGQPPWRRHVGMVFQNYALWPHLSVFDNVAFGLVERRVDRATIKSRVGAALDLVGLAAYAQRRPNQLSGGQQQRVALARTIVIEPQVLLLDEPLSNLDKSLRVQMREELLALQRRLGLTTIFVTHDQEEAMGTADRMAVLDHGVLQQVGTPAELYDTPANAFVAGFVGTMNLLDATLRARDTASCELSVEGAGDGVLHRVPLPADSAAAVSDRVRLSFRPHSLQLRPSHADVSAAAMDDATQTVWLHGRIESGEFLGSFTRYRVRVGTQTLVADAPHRAGEPKFGAGHAVRLGLDLSQVRMFEWK